MKSRHKRLAFIVAGLAGLGGAAALVLNAFNDNMVFFFSPTQVFAKESPEGRNFRLGGLVEKGSLKREDDGLTVHFVVTDTHKEIPVTYKGILPDLFREGQGVVAQGRLNPDGVFHAEEVLAKHDEKLYAARGEGRPRQRQGQERRHPGGYHANYSVGAGLNPSPFHIEGT